MRKISGLFGALILTIGLVSCGGGGDLTGTTGDITDFSSGSHTRLFNTAGTYAFHCTFHAGMVESLTVQ